MTRPQWNRAENPDLLLRYVETGTAASLLRSLSPRAEGLGVGAVERAHEVFEAFVDADIRYADEPVGTGSGWQEIRGPTEVLRTARLANCVDLAVAFAGACLDVGVHPLMVVLDPLTGGPAHAIVVVWTAGMWPGAGAAADYRDFAPDADGDVTWKRGLRREPDDFGAFLPIDVTHVTRAGATFEEAVRSGAELLVSSTWRTSIVADVGLKYAKQGEFRAEPRKPTGIHTHNEEVAGLDGFRQNLLSRNLPFVHPADPQDPTEPGRLLERLDAETGLPGVLLVGAAGVGKTRTCFEVAELAVREGWAVMHVASGDAMVTSADLFEAIESERADKVLVVLDYLNEYSGLHIPTLRNHLRQQGFGRPTKVALIASCRPGWHITTDAPLGLLFEAVTLEPDATRTAAIRDAIITAVAPRARAEIGLEQMRRTCGDRPVIAMLIAAEAERLHEKGTLREALAHIRPADLLDWLESRLDEDKLLPPRPKNLFTDDDTGPNQALQACAAMLLATPFDETGLLACGQGLTVKAGQLLQGLRSMKWVVDSPTGLVPVHDLVTDQLVENILLERHVDVVRTEVADNVLNACLVAGRAVGRYATNLSRIIRDLHRPRAMVLRTQCASWLASRAETVGEILAGGEDEGSYALGAVLDNPSWSTVAFAEWPLVVNPWLQQHASSISARHLLYKGLRSELGRTDERLVAAALTWLTQHGTTAAAGFVLSPLLGRPLDDDAATTAVAAALTWLTRHGTTPDAGFVLDTLLGRPLDDRAAATTVAAALRWLTRHGTTPEAQFVLNSLLGRPLDDDAATTAVATATTWLTHHGTTPGARFVLNRLLGRPLDDDAATTIVATALTWLTHHGTTPEAQFVLNSLLGRPLDDDATTTAVATATTWLTHHGTTPDAGFVLNRMLGRPLDDAATTAALTWLTHHGTTPGAGFVLEPLLKRPLDDRAATTAVAAANTWLTHHGTTPEAGFVLNPLLTRPLDDRAATTAVAAANTWLTHHGTTSDAQFVLNSLLGRPLDDDAATTIVATALTWLTHHGTTPEAQFVLNPLLTRQLDDRAATTAVATALTWLTHRGTTPDAQFVLNPLLARQLDDRAAATAVAAATTWLTHHGTTPDAQFVLGRLLPMQPVGELRRTVVQWSLAWIEVNGVGSDLVSKFVSRQRETTMHVAIKFIDWAMANPENEDVSWRLTRVARDLGKWPDLAVPLLTAVERVVWTLPAAATTINSASEVDSLMRYLCQAPALTVGIPGARLDDLLRAWLSRPESLSPHCSPGTHFLPLASRISSLFVVPGKAPNMPHETLDRLESWIHRWKSEGDERAAALECVKLVRRFPYSEPE
ncbi:hypothetical protein B0I31_104149 [Saccharothrix carnea]|uniref:Uncharacterized protein n=1 Tax=Saccharothrix carnea TaxID=1280637 RepID=A0A2P8IBL2_SACCR|nr:hypothetical protein [Saccharothrix carnea]PSL55858.1 hypothetical protein B0I31_104149 [Saccharothrix carnea]